MHVAPHVGAWIETVMSGINTAANMSHPMWVRGLKQQLKRWTYLHFAVAPHVGAWIETCISQVV